MWPRSKSDYLFKVIYICLNTGICQSCKFNINLSRTFSFLKQGFRQGGGSRGVRNPPPHHSAQKVGYPPLLENKNIFNILLPFQLKKDHFKH